MSAPLLLLWTQPLWPTKGCWELLIVNTFFAWHPFVLLSGIFFQLLQLKMCIYTVRQPIRISKGQHTIVDWCLMTKTEQPFCLCGGIWSLINSREEPLVVSCLTSLWHFAKKKTCLNCIFIVNYIFWYREFSHDVFKFLNSYLYTTFQLNDILPLETSTF